ncbi:MAG: VTT domain-containing protein [Thermodesulfobacteriota bacterium]
MKLTYLKLWLILSIIFAIGLVFCLDLQQYLTIDYFKSQFNYYQQYYEQNQLLSLGFFAVVLFLLTAFSVPGIVVIFLAGGSLFGFPLALLISSFVDAIGSTIAFLSSRYLFGSIIQVKYANKLQSINNRADGEWGLFLFSLRLMPFFPCFLINILMGLTKIRVITFYLATQIGKMPYIAIYINAGSQLVKIDSAMDIFSPKLIISFIMIGLFPMISKKSLQWIKIHRIKSNT